MYNGNVTGFTLSDTFQIIFSVPYIFSPTTTDKEYSTDSIFSDEIVYASVTLSLVVSCMLI